MKKSPLYSRYINSSNEKLIVIIENKNLYELETVEVVRAILEERDFDSGFVKTIAKSLIHEHLEHFFANYNIYSDELVLPKSEFLNEDEVLEIFETEFEHYQNERLDFVPDINMYMAA